MKICVLGAGVVGVSTAFALSRAGHEVHVIERGADVASGASAANGAQLSYSYVDPFASPSTLRKLPSYLLGADPAVRLGFSAAPSYLRWGLAFLKHCSAARTKENLKSRIELSARSQLAQRCFARECDNRLLSPTGRGKIVLAKTKTQLQKMELAALEKRAGGIAVSALSRDACIEIEPALASWTGEWAGGLYAKQDQALDPQKYCRVLRAYSEQHYNAKYHFNEKIASLDVVNGKVRGVRTQAALHACDKVVVCLGPQANSVLSPLGLQVPIYSIQGYSLTFPANSNANVASITDLEHKIVFANLGKTIRIAGFMDTHQSESKSHRRCKQLHALAQRLWPEIADYEADPNYWTQCRPMVPSGVPIVKQSGIDGLYLNVGHGSLGYTFAAGSAMAIADLLDGEHRHAKHRIERISYV